MKLCTRVCIKSSLLWSHECLPKPPLWLQGLVFSPEQISLGFLLNLDHSLLGRFLAILAF